MNPFSVMNPNSPSMGVNQMKNMYQMIMGSRNPMMAFQQLASNNPQLQPVLQMLQRGANPEQIFRQMCQQRNINADDMINQIKSNMR